MLTMLLRLPIELLWTVYYMLLAVADVLAGRKRRRFESTIFIRAPRDAVWDFFSASRVVFDGPPALEIAAELLPGEERLTLARISVGGRELARVVARSLKLDAAEGISLSQVVPHELSLPPMQGEDYFSGAAIKKAPGGTTFTIHNEVTFGSFGQRIGLPLGVRGMAARIKRQCEKAAGTQSRLAQVANHWLVLSLLTVASFWYLLGWQGALLITLVVVLHELGHVAAMRMVGIPVHGIYLIPFFGGVAVPRTAYRSQGELGFVALMGAGFSLIPTLALIGYFYATGAPWALHAALMFAIINGINLVPVYPLDGGLILNALLASFSGRLARLAAWAGVLVGLGVGLYLSPLLLGLPFLLFALGLFLCGTLRGDIKRLSLMGGTALVLAFAGTFAAYFGTFVYGDHAQAVVFGRVAVTSWADALPVPLRCDLPVSSGDVLDRYLSERTETQGNAMLRTLAWAGRAGHSDLVRRRLDVPGDVRIPRDIAIARASRIGDWLDLAREGSLAAIRAEIARLQSNQGFVREILSRALVVNGRYRDAVQLLPRDVQQNWLMAWLQVVLTDLVEAGATAEALELLEGARSETVASGISHHLAVLAARLPQVPAQGRQALSDTLAGQLRDVLKAHPLAKMPQACLQMQGRGACTDQDRSELWRHLEQLLARVGDIAALVRLGHSDIALPEDLGRGSDWSPTLRGLRHLIVEPPTQVPPRPQVAADAGQTQADTDPSWPGPLGTDSGGNPDNYLDLAYDTYIALNLGRGDIEKAEALAEARYRRRTSAFEVRALMINHYLREGDWARAEGWASRQLSLTNLEPHDLPPDQQQTVEYQPSYVAELHNTLELRYRLQLAEAAAIRGEAGLADAALKRAGSLACESAGLSMDSRDQWAVFLRRAYLVKAVQEGRVPAHAIVLRPD